MINGGTKSIFITPAIIVSVSLFVSSIIAAVNAGYDRLAWIGAALACIPLPLLIGRLMLSRVERTSENLPILLVLSVIGTSLAAWEFLFEGAAGWQPLVVAAAGLAIFVIYVFWYSRFGRISSPQLAVGNTLPEFEISDISGNPFRSSELLGAPAVLLFYRGNWCPLCMAQIREIAGRYQDLQELGVTVALVSPQPDGHSRQLAEKYEVPFRYLVDSGNRLAEALGIAVRRGVPLGIPGGYAPDTVLPTVVVTNASGTIVFSDQTDNYRVRPEPDDFIAILRRAGAITA